MRQIHTLRFLAAPDRHALPANVALPDRIADSLCRLPHAVATPAFRGDSIPSPAAILDSYLLWRSIIDLPSGPCRTTLRFPPADRIPPAPQSFPPYSSAHLLE